MVYIKKFLVISFIVFLSGCATLGEKGKTFEEGYRAGVKENVSDFAKNFHGNDFPYFYWESPIVQDVRIPASIENGMFVPEHNEPVVITPAQWRSSFTYPINCQTDKNRSNKKEEEGNYAFTNVNFSVRDITVLPRSFTCAVPGREDKDSH
jgi:hypothetical protein